ncbi:MAG TPA: ATP-binding protein [Bacteroidales bacterium]|nr:ATP-binding protein [Bacteroidales bacterium]
MSSGREESDFNKEEAEAKSIELERKLSHSYYLLQYIIEHDHSIAVLDRSLRYMYVSKRFLSDYKVTETEILGKNHYEVFPTLPEKWKEAHRKALSGEVVSSDEDSFVNINGNYEWVKWECRPWYEADQSIGGIILYTETITKYKEAEIELTNAKERAEESNRLKTAFLQNISHEVRTPLNSIVGFAELLADPSQSIQKRNSFSKIISANSQKLIRIISDVIEISQIQSKQLKVVMSEFDIVSLLYKVADTFRELTQLKGIDFIIDQKINVEEANIVSDKGKIEKIFFHLIDNAVKFTKRGTIKIETFIEGQDFHFAIYDTGIGIEREKQEIIFDPFRQLETGLSRNYGGTGLGLTIVKAFTESLKGNLTLKSEENSGTSILINVPVSLESIEKPESKKQKTGKEETNTILIAEDEYSNFKYLYEVLHSEKLEIIHANNGKEAVDICRRNDDIKMILMDLKMPVMDGTTAAKQIKEFREELPIIAQTAYIPDEEKIKKVFDDLIAKPIRRSDLLQMISRYISIPDLVSDSQH